MMITIQMLRAMSVTVLGVVLFRTPTLAEFDHRAVVPPIQAPQHEGVFEGRPAEMESIHPYRLDLSPDFHAGRDLNVKNGEWRASGFRDPNISSWPSMDVRPGQIPAYDQETRASRCGAGKGGCRDSADCQVVNAAGLALS